MNKASEKQESDAYNAWFSADRCIWLAVCLTNKLKVPTCKQEKSQDDDIIKYHPRSTRCIVYYNTGKSQAFRGTWTPNADGSVRQFFEQQTPDSQEWTVWFDGLYVRTNSE